jgi:hypothetical protein
MRFVHEKKSCENARGCRGFLFEPGLSWRAAAFCLPAARKTLTFGAAVPLLLGIVAKTTPASATQLAPIAVSLVVQETCQIRSSDATQPLAMPNVWCLHGAASAIQRAPLDPTQSLSTFEAARQMTQSTVLTVAF